MAEVKFPQKSVGQKWLMRLSTVCHWRKRTSIIYGRRITPLYTSLKFSSQICSRCQGIL